MTRLIWAESRFRVHAVSPKGAQGIAQFMPATAAERGLADPFDPEQAVPKAARLVAGRSGGQDFIRGVSLWSHLANVGDVEKPDHPPREHDYRQLSDDELRAAGVGPGTVRLSVGTETAADLIWDLEQGFALVAATAGREESEGHDRSQPVSGPAGDPARAAHRQDDRDRGPVEQTSCGPATSSATTSSGTATA